MSFLTMTFEGKLTFENGNTVNVYSKSTKKGTRYYYQSGTRSIPVSFGEVAHIVKK